MSSSKRSSGAAHQVSMNRSCLMTVCGVRRTTWPNRTRPGYRETVIESTSERKVRSHLDTLMTAAYSSGLLEFDVTYRGLPGALSIINFHLKTDVTSVTYADLLRSLGNKHGRGSETINDENIAFLLTKTIWDMEYGSVALIYADDFFGEDSISLEYRKTQTSNRSVP